MSKDHTHSVKKYMKAMVCYNACIFAPVAQLDRVLVSEAKGRGFDSRRAHQIFHIKRLINVRGSITLSKRQLYACNLSVHFSSTAFSGNTSFVN